MPLVHFYRFLGHQETCNKRTAQKPYLKMLEEEGKGEIESDDDLETLQVGNQTSQDFLYKFLFYVVKI